MWADIGRAELKYKTPRIEKEFSQLFEKNPELYQIVKEIEFVGKLWFRKTIVITEVYRTQKEQDRYYRNKKKFISPHQRWLAVDLRTRNLESEQITSLVNHINKNVNYKNTYIPTAFYHDIGLGKHIHIQFKKRK